MTVVFTLHTWQRKIPSITSLPSARWPSRGWSFSTRRLCRKFRWRARNWTKWLRRKPLVCSPTAGSFTPPRAESFVDLRARAVAAINRALSRPAPVLVVAHGALFRALRAEMGLEPNVRTPNAMPYFCEPGTPAWSLTAAG